MRRMAVNFGFSEFIAGDKHEDCSGFRGIYRWRSAPMLVFYKSHNCFIDAEHPLLPTSNAHAKAAAPW